MGPALVAAQASTQYPGQHTSSNTSVTAAYHISHSPQHQRPVTPGLHARESGPRHSRASSCASLLFDLEIDADDLLDNAPAPRLPLELQRLVSSNGRAEALLWMHALQAKEALSSERGAVDIHAFAQALANMGHLVWLRNGTYTCPAETGLSSIKHTFVVAALSSDHFSQPMYCVVDPNWQEHFRLSGAGAAEYRQLLSLLPDVFVGCANKLAKLVTLLCKEMEKVFQARGVPLPPWRSPHIMQGRWLVNHAEDEYVPATNIPFNRTQSTKLTQALVM